MKSEIAYKAPIVVDVISGLFILLFLYTALSKTFQIYSMLEVIKQTPLLSSIPKEIAWTIVTLEYATTLLLFIPKTKKIGLYFSCFLMLIFTLYIIYMKVTLQSLPCSCGGIIAKMTWNQHLIFNICFTLLALVAILLTRKSMKSSKPEGDALGAAFS